MTGKGMTRYNSHQQRLSTHQENNPSSSSSSSSSHDARDEVRYESGGGQQSVHGKDGWRRGGSNPWLPKERHYGHDQRFGHSTLSFGDYYAHFRQVTTPPDR